MTRPCQDWHPEDIKAAIRKTGITLRALALQHGFSEGACRNALRCPSPRLEMVMARHLGMRPEEIWPSRYTTEGVLLRTPSGGKKRSEIEAPAHRQIGDAA